MKQYLLIYLDKKGNELKSIIHHAPNRGLARGYANLILANSLLSDLHKIRIVTLNRP